MMEYQSGKSENKDAPWMFTAWAVSYPKKNDPFLLPDDGLGTNVMDRVWGIWMKLEDEELFRLRNIMLVIDEKEIEKEIDEDGNERIIRGYRYRSALPFLRVFNKSVYDVIFREHQRLTDEVGKSKCTKALLRFDDWFKQNGIVDHNEIEPFWSSTFDETATVTVSEPDPPPLSAGDDWRDVLLEIEQRSSGKFDLCVSHQSLNRQQGVVLSMDDWQPKLRDILIMHGIDPSYRLDPDELVERWGEKIGITEITRDNIYLLKAVLRNSVGITDSQPILHKEKMEFGKYPVEPSVRLGKKLVWKLLRIDIQDAEMFKEYSELWHYTCPIWMKPS